MNRCIRLKSVAATTLLLLFARSATAQVMSSPGAGEVIVPQSSVLHPSDFGVRAHTNIKIFAPLGGMSNLPPAGIHPMEVGPPASGFFFETPASLGCVYKLVSPSAGGCNPNVVTANPSGGSRAVAVVDAFHYPTALNDLKKFSAQFGLPVPTSSTFSVVFAGGVQPPQDPSGGWELEAALDIEWAHAMAPGAKIVLVEARSNSLADLLAAEDVASTKVATAGGGEVSNGWGGPEFKTETTLDSHFKRPGIVYFAAAGDSPGTEYPSVSPFVVSAGGTATTRNVVTGAFLKEVAWQDAGSGISAFESRPGYQNGVSLIVGTHRGTPDFSFDSNPANGVYVYDTTPFNGQACDPVFNPLTCWFALGGTSLASCALAGVVNSAGHFAASSNAELTTIYANRANQADFRDITLGNCGPYSGLFATVGYDLCTGVGSDQGKVNK
jgi:kumamolisin